MSTRPHDERGLTLTEVMVVIVLATIVMTGIIGFYLNSQAVWFDGSSKVITQREVSLVLKAISDRTRPDSTVVITPSPDADHAMLTLIPYGSLPPDSNYSYWWSAADSLIHEGYRTPAIIDRGPMLRSKVERFRVSIAGPLVSIQSLRARTPQGVRVDLSTNVALVTR